MMQNYDPERNVWSTDYGFALQDPNYVRDGNNTTFQRTYEWNERNLLKRSHDQQYTVHYRYGVDGQRAVKFTEQNNKEQLYFNKMYQLSSGEGMGLWMESKHIYVGETRIVTARNEAGNDNTAYQERNRFFYHSDHLGSAQLVTDYNGRTYERIEYTPYGESWIEWKDYSENNYVTPFRFTSKEKDMETGLYYYGARYLDAKTSRWMSADPALGEYIPGAPINDEVKKQNQNLPGMGGVFNYVNMHLYHYAGNNPIKYLDPDGEQSIIALFLIEAKSETIKAVAEKYDVDPLGIAMVLYQENYWGIDAVNAKDQIGLKFRTGTSEVTDETYETFSAGIGQIQLKRAATLLGMDINEPGAKKEIYDTLMDHDKAIDLIGANLKYEEGLLGRKIKGEEGGYAHNMGASGYQRYLSGDKNISDRIAKRSPRDVELIRSALNGKIDIPSYSE